MTALAVEVQSAKQRAKLVAREDGGEPAPAPAPAGGHAIGSIEHAVQVRCWTGGGGLGLLVAAVAVPGVALARCIPSRLQAGPCPACHLRRHAKLARQQRSPPLRL
jgi:hypothetical protein